MFSTAYLLTACTSISALSVLDPAQADADYKTAHALYQSSVSKANSLLTNMKSAITNLRSQAGKYEESQAHSLALLEQKSKQENEQLESEEKKAEAEMNAIALKSSSLLQTFEAPKLIDEDNLSAWKEKLVAALEKLKPFTKGSPSFLQLRDNQWSEEAERFAASVVPKVSEKADGIDLEALQARVMQLGEKLNKDIIISEQHIRSIKESAKSP